MRVPLNAGRRAGRWQDELFTLLGDIEAWQDNQGRDEDNPFLDAVDVAAGHVRDAHRALFWWEEERTISEDIEW